jgi:hypothetical protein
MHALSRIKLQTGALQLLPLALEPETLGAKQIRQILFRLGFLLNG